MRIKLAAVLAFVLFAVLAGGGVAQAYWLSQVSASSTVQVATLASNCTPATKLGNGSFETPVIPNSSYQQGAVSPWSTTDARGIELWSNGFNGVPAAVGRQFVELNAESAGTLWQDIATTPGQTIRWSLLHRAREGVDTMRVSLGPVGTSGGVSQGTYSATTSSWTRHEGTYTVPTGQTTTRFSMTAVSTGSGNPTIGNFIDDVSFGSGPCLKPESTVTNTSRALSQTRVGDVLNYTTTVTNTGGSQALTSSLSAVLPAGIDYQPNTLKINGVVPATGLVSYDASKRTLTSRLGLGATATTGGSIEPSGTMTVTFTAVATAFGLGSPVDYIATTAYTDYLAPGWPQSWASAPVGFTITAADVAVVATGTPTATVGSTATWTFSVTNNGPSAAVDVTAQVTIPAGVTNASVVHTTSNNGTGSSACIGTATPRTCSLGTLNSGETRIITLGGRVNSTQSSYVSKATASSSTYDHVSTNDVATSAATIPDVQAPSTPGGLNATETTASQTTIRWTASTDNRPGVISYDVFRDGVKVSTTTSPSLTDTALDSETLYSYTVVAFDEAGNRSQPSAALRVLTLEPNQRYAITSSTGGNCLAAAGPGNNEELRLVACATNSSLQQWRFEDASSTGYFKVKAGSGRIWDIKNGWAQVSGDGSQNDRQWRPVSRVVGGVFYIGFENLNGDCLVLPSSGTQLRAVSCANSAAQSFLLTRVP